MNELAASGTARLWIEKLHRPYEFVSPFDGADFVVLILAYDPTLTPDEQAHLSEQLVRQGGRYVLSTGYDATSWDTSVDYAYMLSDPDFHPPGDRFVMTTRHDDETPEEIVEWFLLRTAFENFVLSNFLIVMLGRHPIEEEFVRIAIDRFGSSSRSSPTRP